MRKARRRASEVGRHDPELPFTSMNMNVEDEAEQNISSETQHNVETVVNIYCVCGMLVMQNPSTQAFIHRSPWLKQYLREKEKGIVYSQ